MLGKELRDHENRCGAVTEVCQKCKGRFPRRELMIHESGCTGVRPPPGAAPRRVEQDFMTCEKCSAAFTLFDELQVHILTAHFEDSEKFTLFGGSGFPK